MDEKYAIAVALVVGLVEVVKKLGVPKEILPVASIIFGILIIGLPLFTSVAITEVITMGVMIGLMAVGSYESLKVPAKAILGKLGKKS